MHGARFRICAIVGLLGTFLLTATHSAEAAKGKRAAYAENLRQARTLLNDAERDYDGHRDRAMKELTLAIEDLEGTKAHKIADAAPSTAKHLNSAPPEKQTQQQSDAKMRHALAIMQPCCRKSPPSIPGRPAVCKRPSIK